MESETSDETATLPGESAESTEPAVEQQQSVLGPADHVRHAAIIAHQEYYLSFKNRWIVRKGTEYQATPSGRFIAREYNRFMGNLQAYADLPPVVEWFPGDEPTFDLGLLDDATVVTADEGDLIAPIRNSAIDSCSSTTNSPNSSTEPTNSGLSATVSHTSSPTPFEKRWHGDRPPP